jgi:IS5 family transposase
VFSQSLQLRPYFNLPPSEVVLRTLILKHLHDWSFDELEQEMRANLVYRAFTRIGVDAVPDAKTILKIAKALGPAVITDLHQRVVDVAKRAGVTHGRRFASIRPS